MAELFAIFMMVPALALVFVTAFSNDRRTQEAALLMASLWYGATFCIAGFIYIFNTLTEISTYGK